MLQNVTLYRHAGHFAGWPANFGIWSWGNEIVVGFTVGHFLNSPEAGFHARDASRPFLPMQARSEDGGHTWQVDPTPCRLPGGRGFSADEHVQPELQVAPILDTPEGPDAPPGDIDFSAPNFALMCARSGLEDGARSWFYVSEDRCHSWIGPFWLPLFGQRGVAARTDYLVCAPSECILFLTATKADGKEGRPFCAQSTDAGKSFKFLSWIGEEPQQGHAIMPASVQLSPAHYLVAVRRSGRPSFIELYESTDAGCHWLLKNRPVEDTGRGGNPPTLTRLYDGRLCITYGYRQPPFGIQAVISEDEGRTWSQPRTLRADAGNHDIGYPRTVQRADGCMVTVYYYNDDPMQERYIAATIWEP